jgi:integral membrane protein
MTGPAASQIEQIKKVLKLFSVSSYITGIFLMLLMITWGIRRLPFLGYDLWLLGPNGFITFEQYGVEGEGLPDVGVNLTVAILIVHGWLYVLYLFADFRLWTLMRWSFFRFLIIAAGGVVPLLSFFTESYYAKLARKQLSEIEGQK